MNGFAGIRAGIPAALALRLALVEKPQGCRVAGRIAPAPVLKPDGRAGVLDEKIHIASALEVDRPIAVLGGTLDKRIDRFFVAARGAGREAAVTRAPRQFVQGLNTNAGGGVLQGESGKILQAVGLMW